MRRGPMALLATGLLAGTGLAVAGSFGAPVHVQLATPGG